MKSYKRILTILSVLVIVLGIAACTPKAPVTDDSNSGSPDAMDYPKKPINILVGFNAGGGADLATRLAAQYAAKELGVDIVVSNVPGGSGTIAHQQLIDSKPDGYTLAYISNTSSNSGRLFDGIEYDIDDFTPIVQLASDPHVIIANNELGVTNIDEMVELVKAKPKSYTFAMGGTWSTHELCRLALENNLGISFKRLLFDGGKPGAIAVAAGDSDFAAPFYSEGSSILKSETVNVIATTGRERLDLLPDVPTVAELTGKEIYAYNWRGLVGPAGIDPEIVAILSDAFEKANSNPEYLEAAKTSGIGLDFLNDKDFETFFKSNHEEIKVLIENTVIE